MLLYLIEILHQTTTIRRFACLLGRLYLIEILHQTTTAVLRIIIPLMLYLIEILHQTTTEGIVSRGEVQLYLIEILHQTTTGLHADHAQRRCILLKFYIKPQLPGLDAQAHMVVSY